MKHLFTTAIILLLLMTLLAACATAQTSGGTVSGNAPTTAGGSGNQAALTWTLATISEGIPSYMSSVAYGNGRFVGVMRIAMPAGWTWSASSPPTLKMLYSTDGITWTVKDTDDGTGKNPTAIGRIAYSNVQE